MRQEMASYQEGVKIMDEYMGRILYALEQYGLAENTLVILTTDHGIEFPGCKKTLTDQGIGVMLMMRGPHGFTGGRVIESLVSQLDIFPTLCSILGIERFPWLRGCDLMPIIRGEKESVRDEIFAEQTYHGTLEPLRCVRTERYKLVLRHSETGPLCRHDGKSSNAMEEYGWYSRNLGKEEFFDLYLDPMEACNRIQDPACQPQIKDLRTRLNGWMTETGDSFPTGNFPPPPPKRS
jgi:N-sulfoglucosamine sulfohydrolase